MQKNYNHFIGLLLLAIGAAWHAPALSAQSLYADPKANRAGDVVTIILAERTSAQRESGFQNQSSAGMGGASAVEGGQDLSGQFAVDASFNKSARNRNETMQRDLLQGTITAVVTAQDSVGNLVLRGERKLNVNGVTHLMRVSGRVRPFDVRADNTVLSYQIADAYIEYRRAGLGRRFIKPGFLAKVGAVAALGAAVFFATQ